MEFQEFKDFKTSVNALKMVTIISVCLAISGVIGLYVLNVTNEATMMSKFEESRQKNFVLDPISGRLLKGDYRLQNELDHQIIYKGLVKEFVGSMYDFDGHSIRENVENGLGLCTSEVGEKIVLTYFNSNKDMESEMLQENSSFYASVDSIKFDNNDLKHGWVLARQKLQKPYGADTRLLKCEFWITQTNKITDRNVYGAVISNWIFNAVGIGKNGEILDNK